MSISHVDVNQILERLERLEKGSEKGGAPSHPLENAPAKTPVQERIARAENPASTPKREPSAEEAPALAKTDSHSDLSFLRSNEIFGRVPEEELARFVELGRPREYSAGKPVFKVGQICDRIIAIRKGILEICRDGEGDDGRVALLGMGEVLGLLGALTGGRHRSSGDFPEGGEILVIDAKEFVDSLESFPHISAALSRQLARRLIGAVQNTDMGRASKRQLEGSLAHFDLTAVLQSIIANESSAGTLTILDSAGAVVADILIGCGRIVACQYGRLSDVEAFRQLYLKDHHEHRFFYVESDEAHRAAERCESGLGGMNGVGLLMDCARLADEKSRLDEGPLGDDSTFVERLPGQARWEDRATLALYRRLIKFLIRRRRISEILEEEKESRFRVLNVLQDMLAQEQIRIVS